MLEKGIFVGAVCALFRVLRNELAQFAKGGELGFFGSHSGFCYAIHTTKHLGGSQEQNRGIPLLLMGGLFSGPQPMK